MKVCAHCGRRFRVGGSIFTGGVEYPLCHPDDGLDCYRLVTVYGETIGARLNGLVEIDKTQHAGPRSEPREWGPLDEIRG